MRAEGRYPGPGDGSDQSRNSAGFMGSLGKFVAEMGWLTKSLVVVNILVYVFEWYMDWKFYQYCIWLPKMVDGEIFRVVTAAFSHVDFKHIFFNMVTLVLFSPPLEKHHGFLKY
mmetsp:Transcript_916/g.918  ORF Transcript_916/g.918 Transcript_916/m.918 type:complete len:114 (+) Transcript_916:2-343(+)